MSSTPAKPVPPRPGHAGNAVAHGAVPAPLPTLANASPAPSSLSKPPAPVAPAAVVEPGSAKASAAPRLPRDELNTLAEDYGLDPTRFDTRAQVLEALADRKRLIATLDRDAMLEVVRWGRRPVARDASREQLALEIARVTRMQFEGLSRAGLLVLARLRGVTCDDEEPVESLARRLRRKEGLFSKINRKRRGVIGALASKIVGEHEADEPYRYLPPSTDEANANLTAAPAAPPRLPALPPPRLREQIEERGLFGGLADRVRRSADTYVNTKLDEIEARIDRKLDEIDKRLAEWRDKEIANRVRIIKFTLWASVIVSIISLGYAYFTRQVF